MPERKRTEGNTGPWTWLIKAPSGTPRRDMDNSNSGSGGAIARLLGIKLTPMAGLFGLAYLGAVGRSGDSPAEGGDSKEKFNLIASLIESKQELDQDMVDAIRTIAQIASPGKTVGEVAQHVLKVSGDQSFEGAFKEATGETPPAEKTRKQTPTSQQPPEKQQKKSPDKTQAQDLGKPEPKSPTEEQGPGETLLKETPREGTPTPREYGESEKMTRVQEEGVPTSFEDQYEYYFREATGETPPPSESEDEEMKERWKRLDEFVDQITGRKD